MLKSIIKFLLSTMTLSFLVLVIALLFDTILIDNWFLQSSISVLLLLMIGQSVGLFLGLFLLLISVLIKAQYDA